MAKVLQLQFLLAEGAQNDTALAEQKQMLESTPLLIPNLKTDFNICFLDDNYHLTIADQMIPLRDGAILKSENFTVRVTIQDSPVASQDEEAAQEIEASIINEEKQVTNHPDFALAELNREHNYLELSTLTQPENSNDELDFLFNNNSLQTFGRPVNQTNNFTGMMLNGSDPLSLLNQHFLPPEVKSPPNPIAIASTIELASSTSQLLTEGNILRDLGLWSELETERELTTYTDTLPSPHTSTFGYRDDNDENKENSHNKSLTTVKKLWQKLLPIN